jgi:ammonia channel protein AmtB
MFLVALGGPVVAYAVYEFTQKRQIDEHKLFPLFAGSGIYGLLMVGLLRAGTPRGGYYGITEGAYAFQHGKVGVLMQIVGIIVCLGTGIVTAAILTPILKATVGLRVSDDDQAAGLDVVFWNGIPPDVQSDTEST